MAKGKSAPDKKNVAGDAHTHTHAQALTDTHKYTNTHSTSII